MKTTRHWSEVGDWSLIWGMRLLLNVYFLCGRSALQCFLYPVVIYYWLVNRSGREASRTYLERIAACMPESKLNGGYYWSCRHFLSFANAIVDKLAAWAGAITVDEVEYHGRSALMDRLECGQGALLLGSHLGNLEVCRVIAGLENDISINVLVHTRHAEKFNGLLNRYNEKSRLNLIQVSEISAATSMLLSDKIAQGELVIIAADRTPVGAPHRVEPADFLGGTALFPQGPFILASILKCPVFTIFCLKRNNKFVIHFDHFSDGLRFSRKSRHRELRRTVQEYASRLQDYCLKEPLQWFNFYDFWRVKSDV
ncbi:MAG: LpxL/LpxP family acyltransferase [Gammaproteobacteria bacterium]